MKALHAAGLGTTLAAATLLAGPSIAQAQEMVVVESSPPAAVSLDGIFQGIGALQILGSFVFPESRAAATIVGSDGTPAVSFRVMPTKIARGSGLVAFGEF
jgi:hypothetical protein